MTPLPLAVDLRGRRVLVVGAGPVGARKVRALVEHGADVHVVAPDVAPDIEGLATVARRTYEPGDLDGAALVVAATGDGHVNAAVAAEAERRGLLCVRADGGGSASFLAAVRRGDLLLAVSTSGTAPALAARIRQELEDAYGLEYGQLASLLGELRDDARLEGLQPDERAVVWRRILDTDILDHLRNNDLDLAREVASACLSSSSD